MQTYQDSRRFQSEKGTRRVAISCDYRLDYATILICQGQSERAPLRNVIFRRNHSTMQSSWRNRSLRDCCPAFSLVILKPRQFHFVSSSSSLASTFFVVLRKVYIAYSSSTHTHTADLWKSTERERETDGVVRWKIFKRSDCRRCDGRSITTYENNCSTTMVVKNMRTLLNIHRHVSTHGDRTI